MDEYYDHIIHIIITLFESYYSEGVLEVGHGARSVAYPYKGEYKSVRIKNFDTPGYYKGKRYHSSIFLNIDKGIQFDLILICTRLEDRADQNMFLGLASILHEEMRKRTIVVLTFASHFIRLQSVGHHHSGPEVAIREEINDHKARIVKIFSKYNIKREILEGILFCIAGLKDEKKLPTTDDWMKTLWETCIDRCSDEPHVLVKESSPCVII